ncbi:MAG TPA: DUF456 domain-containing protein [Steroidobacteraceae bacterium]
MNLAHVALWCGAFALIAAGLVLTIVPGMPGVLLIYGGMWLAAWIGHFARIGWPTLILLGVLTALALVIDLTASVLGAKRVGASRQALLGSFIGGFAGLAFGLPGLIAGPFAGAVIGELMARRTLVAATRVGLWTWIGLLAGTLAKLALAVTMLAVFAVACLI